MGEPGWKRTKTTVTDKAGERIPGLVFIGEWYKGITTDSKIVNEVRFLCQLVGTFPMLTL